jgi:hypothetical protein
MPVVSTRRQGAAAAAVAGLCLWVAAVAGEEPEVQRRNGALRITVGGTPLLEYQAALVQPPADFVEQVAAGVRKYAVARGGYIHPLYGPHGETLTADWNHDHPHHRGVYWAWPEVQFGGETKDLHALQGIVRRPAGEAEVHTGCDWAEIRGHHQWFWNEETPLVDEWAVIRGQAAGGGGRYVDLTVELTALADGVTLARRGTKLYGGLNIRLAKAQGLALAHHADGPRHEAEPAFRDPGMAWQYASGTWPGADHACTWVVFECVHNPGYPGDYVEYPDLPWFQPAFPRAGQRFELSRQRPLTLRYRCWILPGAAPAEDLLRREWTSFNSRWLVPVEPAAPGPSARR